MVKQQHQLFVALLVVVDGLVVALASYAAWGVRRGVIEGFSAKSWETYFKEPLVFFTVPIALYAMWGMGLYRPRRDRSMWGEQVQVFKASLAAIAATVVALWLVGHDLIAVDPASVNPGDPKFRTVTLWGFPLSAGKVQLGSLAVFLLAALSLHRAAFRITLRSMRRRGWNLRHVAVIGDGRLGQIVARTLERNSWTGLKVAYFVSHQDQTVRDRCLDRPVHGGLADLDRTVRKHKIDAVYVALPTARSNLLSEVLARLEKFPVDVRVVPDLNPRHLPQNMMVSELEGMPILSYRECTATGVGGVSKRIVDFLGAAACLLAFAPLMLAVMALIRLSGPGPVIFKQRRVSIGGGVFKIYKFRTMYHVEDEAGGRARPTDRRDACQAAWTERDDPRITPIGRWLRRTSLDELPQLINVINGDMSLVGPRPERPELIERFREDWRGYMLRQHVKAGMTGWAQVNGLRGQTSLRKRLQYDLFYVRNWSLALDFRILFLTLFRGFVHRNAH